LGTTTQRWSGNYAVVRKRRSFLIRTMLFSSFQVSNLSKCCVNCPAFFYNTTINSTYWFLSGRLLFFIFLKINVLFLIFKNWKLMLSIFISTYIFWKVTGCCCVQLRCEIFKLYSSEWTRTEDFVYFGSNDNRRFHEI
jgi:hypothetical protein